MSICNENCVYIHNGILFSLLRKKEALPYTITQMNQEDTMLSEISQTETYTMYHLHAEFFSLKKKKSEFIETESKMMVARGWGNSTALSAYVLTQMTSKEGKTQMQTKKASTREMVGFLVLHCRSGQAYPPGTAGDISSRAGYRPEACQLKQKGPT